MAYRIGIDLGTASIGLVCLELDENKRPISIPYHCVHIFQEVYQAFRWWGIEGYARIANYYTD